MGGSSIENGRIRRAIALNNRCTQSPHGIGYHDSFGHMRCVGMQDAAYVTVYHYLVTDGHGRFVFTVSFVQPVAPGLEGIGTGHDPAVAFDELIGRDIED